MKRSIVAVVVLIIAVTGIVACHSSRKTTMRKPLIETNWQLTKVGGISYDPAPGVRKIFIKMGKENRLSGFLGCNNLIGSYKRGPDDRISFMGASTKMFCKGDAMRYEDALNKALSDARRYKIDGNRLMLMQDDGNWLAEFRAME